MIKISVYYHDYIGNMNKEKQNRMCQKAMDSRNIILLAYVDPRRKKQGDKRHLKKKEIRPHDYIRRAAHHIKGASSFGTREEKRFGKSRTTRKKRWRLKHMPRGNLSIEDSSDNCLVLISLSKLLNPFIMSCKFSLIRSEMILCNSN